MSAEARGVEHLLVVGASARAAAGSFRRRGFAVSAIDLFADTDLVRIACRAERLEGADWPGAIPALASRFPAGPFVAAGGLENHPDVLEELERSRVNLGPGAGAVRAVRDPARLARALDAAGLPHARSVTAPADPADLPLIVKPRLSCGGRAMRRVDPGQPVGCVEGSLVQEFLEGPSCGVVYSATAGRCRTLGASLQLVGEARLGARPFAYCGSVGPLALGRGREVADAIGSALVRAFGLEGLFGVDAILVGGVPHVVEVNPRYTASTEVLERAADIGGIAGKAVLFATRDLRFPGVAPDLAPDVADVPAPGTPVAAGGPVLTVFAAHSTGVERCREELLERAETLRGLLDEPLAPPA